VEIFAAQSAPLVSSSSLEGVSSLILFPLFDTGGKFATNINDTSGISGQIYPMSFTPVVRLDLQRISSESSKIF
jgi:hypothetical protein